MILREKTDNFEEGLSCSLDTYRYTDTIEIKQARWLENVYKRAVHKVVTETMV